MRVNLSELVAEAARDVPHEVALVELRPDRREVTWAELDEKATAVARGLLGRGLVAGARVALVMANRVDLPIAYFGILRGGMVAVPVNPRSTAPEIARMLADSGARVVLCDDHGVAQLREALASGDHDVEVVVDGAPAEAGETSFDDFLAAAPGTAPAAPRDPEATAVILYTSGTSGRPRGAMLSHRALLANIEQTAAIEPPPLTSDDVALGLLPMFHVYGLNAVLGQAVRQRARTVLVERFDPAGLLELVRAEGITNLALAPPVVAAWAGRPELREALTGVRTVLSGASTLDPELAREFQESSGHAVEQGYGFTEAAPVVTATLASERSAGTTVVPSVGSPLPGVELRVLDADGRPSQDPAQIWVRGDNLFSGYWPDRADGPGPDGWYATGDVGYLTDGGELVLVDRLRELVIVSGFNVYPAEVEAVLADVDGVEQTAVVGVPDEETGEAVLAFVVPTQGADPATVEQAVHDAAARNLARFKRPTRVVVVADLPHSPTGKVAKGRLRALARRDVLGLGPE
ncbi:MAG: AMP-binding protein [Aeromicrobium erythreum]